MDLNGIPSYIETTSESLRNNTIFINKMEDLVAHLTPHLRLVEPVITPRFVPTCTEALLRGLTEMAKERGVRIQSHLSESKDQMAWSTAMWGGKTDVQVFDSLGLLGPTSLMAHCTHATPPVFALLAERDTSIAHCPLSNFYFSATTSAPSRSVGSGLRCRARERK